MRIKLAEMYPTELTGEAITRINKEIDPLEGWGYGHKAFLALRARETERGRWLLEHCTALSVEDYALQEYDVILSTYLVGDLTKPEDITYYMLKYGKN